MTTLQEILPQLKAWFPAEAHKERDLPGGKSTWWYVPWQLIRERLDQVCPDWQVSYGEPSYLDKFCFVSCTLTICGISRQAIGNAPIELISSKGRDMSRGTPIERAIADAFKNAAEAFGVASYLDEQADEKAKAAFIKYMYKHGNAKPAVQWQNQQREEQGLPVRERPKDPPSMPFGQKPKTIASKPTSPPQPIAPPIEEPKVNGANLDRFRALTRFMGINNGDKLIQQAIGQISPGKKSSELSVEECDSVVNQILINYGIPMFKSEQEAIEAFNLSIIDDPTLESADDAKIAQDWLSLLTRQSQQASA